MSPRQRSVVNINSSVYQANSTCFRQQEVELDACEHAVCNMLSNKNTEAGFMLAEP